MGIRKRVGSMTRQGIHEGRDVPPLRISLKYFSSAELFSPFPTALATGIPSVESLVIPPASW